MFYVYYNTVGCLALSNEEKLIKNVIKLLITNTHHQMEHTSKLIYNTYLQMIRKYNIKIFEKKTIIIGFSLANLSH